MFNMSSNRDNSDNASNPVEYADDDIDQRVCKKVEAEREAREILESNNDVLIIPAGKMTDDEAESAIGVILKKLGGRVPKGSKVMLASNVDNLKSKMDEELESLKTINATLQAALMSNAQKLAAMGDAEQLRKDLEEQRSLRFGNSIN